MTRVRPPSSAVSSDTTCHGWNKGTRRATTSFESAATICCEVRGPAEVARPRSS